MNSSRKSSIRLAFVAIFGLLSHVSRRLGLGARIKKWGRRLLLGGAALATTILVVHAFLTHRSAVELEGLLQGIRAAHEPVTASELTPPRLPDAENAAPLYQRAFALRVKDSDTFSDAVFAFEEKGTLDRAAFESQLTSNASAFAAVSEAVRLPRCRFDTDYSGGFQTEMPQLLGVKEMTRLLTLRAQFEANEGRADEALATLDGSYRWNRGLDADAFLIVGLVRVACDNVTTNGLAWVLSHSEPSAPACSRLQATIETTARPREGYRRDLLAERAAAIDAFQQYRISDLRGESDTGVVNPALLRLYRASSWLRNRDECEYLRVVGRMIEAAGKPTSREALAATRAAPAELPGISVISSLFLPSFERCLVKQIEGEARRGLAQLALALRIHRLEHGAYPETLAPLGTVPVDPFTGEAFHYEREGAGFKVWSVGRNGNDDKGVARSEGHEDVDDVVFSVAR